MNTHIKVIIVAALFFFAALFNLQVHAQTSSGTEAPNTSISSKDIPRIISYQGQITNNGSAMNGTHHITATLYSDPNGKNSVWHGAYDADITDGIFTITLGASGSWKLPENATLDQPLWIGISVDGSAEMLPRTQLAAAPYALNVPDQSITFAKLAPDLALGMGTWKNQTPQTAPTEWAEGGNNDLTTSADWFGTITHTKCYLGRQSLLNCAMLRKNIPIALFFIALQAFIGCVNDVPAPNELSLGDSTASNTFTVTTAGGIFFSNLKDTSKGLRIFFGLNSYSTSKVVTVTTTTINGSTFGSNVSSITPLYTISAGNDFSNKNIIVDIPVSLDTNNFSMAFFYDLTTHALEGIPTLGYLNKEKPQRFSITLRHSGSFFVSTIAKSKLAASISSSFDPKQDNWEFPNFGTELTPNGQFVGQSLSALWYYYEQAVKGKAHLYGQFDVDHGGEPPKIWQDNDLGLRVAAETEQALKWNNYAFSMITPLNNGNILLTTDQLIYSMMVTGKPQLITVNKDTSVLPLIIYKVMGGQLYVADPNYPVGESQTISANQGSNYNTAGSMFDLNANGASKYSSATYIGVRAMINWDSITKIWTNAQNNIFTSFLPYTVSFSDASGKLKPSANGFLTLLDTVTYNVIGSPSSVWVYQNNIFSTFTTSNTIALKPGPNPINLYFQNQSPDNTHSVWSGFNTANIQVQSFTITPSLDSSFVENDVVLHTFMGQKPTVSLRYEWDMGDGSPVIKNTDVDNITYRYKKTGTFIVSLSIYRVSDNSFIGKETSTVAIALNPVSLPLDGIHWITTAPYFFYGLINLPKDIVQRCQWTMGDGTATKSIIGNDTIQYTFQNVGMFIIHLDIFDNVTNVYLGSAQTTITISQGQLPTLALLQSMNFVNIKFIGNQNYPGLDANWDFYNKLTWRGNTFSSPSPLLGSCNAILTSVDSFKLDQYNSLSTTQGCFFRNENIQYTLQGFSIPLYSVNDSSITYSISGAVVKNHMQYVGVSDAISTGNNCMPHTDDSFSNYIFTNWNDTTIPPQIIIKFYK